MLGLLALFIAARYESEDRGRVTFDDMAVRAYFAWYSAKESGHREISKANKAIEALF